MNAAMPCAAAADLRTYDTQHAADERYSEAIAQRAAELLATGGSCYPWTHDHIIEAITQADSREFTMHLEAAHELPDNSLSQAEFARVSKEVVLNYWRDMAQVVAQREIDNEMKFACTECGGAGCRACH